MRILLHFLRMYRRYRLLINLGILLSIITMLANVSMVSLSGWFLAKAALTGSARVDTFNYIIPVTAVCSSAVIRTLIRYTERLIKHDATFCVLAKLRIFIFQKLFPLSPGIIVKYQKGDILNRLLADIESIDHLYLRVLSPIFSALVITILIILVLSVLDLQVAILLGLIILCLLITLPPIFYQAGKFIGQDLSVLRSQYRAYLVNIIQSQAELSVFGALPQFWEILKKLELKWLNCQQKQSYLTALSQSIIILISGFSVILVMWVTATGINEKHQSNELVALFIFCTLATFELLSPVVIAFQYLGQIVVSWSRLIELINHKPAVIFSGFRTLTSNKIEIKVQKVQFSYPQQQRMTLKNICMTLNTNEHVALLGKTGCGKSTLLQLLTRAWDVNSGKILINDYPINQYNEKTLRKLMGVLPQRTYIFSDTLRNNLLIAKDNASDDLLIKVLKEVGLDTLIKDYGLDTWIGEGGRQLSGGEARQLGIARVLLYDAPVILLDEPTEALDTETEKKILLNLQQQCSNKVLLIITHRLQGLEKMDKIYVMDNGKIIEKGNHNELLELQGHYFSYYQDKQY